jgi:hypothetical protein
MKYIFRGEKFIAMLTSIAGSVGHVPYVVIIWEGFGTKLLHYLGWEIILPEVILNGLHCVLLTWSILSLLTRKSACCCTLLGLQLFHLCTFQREVVSITLILLKPLNLEMYLNNI